MAIVLLIGDDFVVVTADCNFAAAYAATAAATAAEPGVDCVYNVATVRTLRWQHIHTSETQ